MIEKKLSNATPLDDENVVLRRSDNNFLNKTQITNCILEAPNGVAELAPDGYNFILKQGLKVLIPNGRNADGTLKNIEVTLNKDDTFTGINSSNKNRYYLFVDDLGDSYAVIRYLSGTYANMPTVSDSETISYMYYAIDTNKMYLNFRTTGKIWKEIKCAFVGLIPEFTGQTLTELYPENTINLLKQSDKSIIGSWGMPSNKYIDLSFGASGSTYTAPANGYLRAYITSTGSASLWTFLNISNRNNNLISRSGNWHDTTASYYTLTAFVPMLKGQTAKITYTTAVNITEKILTFVYVEGEI